jgi:mRNA interferase MazF
MKRGEVWQVNLDPTQGAEIKKSRPCVIVNKDELSVLPLKIIVPLTAWKKGYEKASWHVRVKPTKANGLPKESSADTFQVRSISEKRLVKKYGELAPAVLEEVNKALLLSLDLN